MNVNNVSSAAYAYSAGQQQTAGKTPAAETAPATPSAGAVYEPSNTTDRSAIIAQLKADSEQHTSQLRSMVEDMFRQQGKQIGTADDIWSFLAKGNYTVSEAAKKQAQEAISDKGYWGVDQTSSRIVDFAKALAGGDETKIEQLKKAFEKGYKAATKAWGQALPDISRKTYDAVMSKFDDWSGKNKTTTENVK